MAKFKPKKLTLESNMDILNPNKLGTGYNADVLEFRRQAKIAKDKIHRRNNNKYDGPTLFD